MAMISPTDMLEEVRTSNFNLDPETSEEDNLLRKGSRWMTTEELLEDQLLLRMELSTQVNGSMESEMALVPKCGQTVPSMRANGRTIRPTVKVN
jgi:hypothetical protein